MAPPKIHQRFVKQGIWRLFNSPATWPLAPRDKEGGQLSQSVEGRAGQTFPQRSSAAEFVDVDGGAR